MHLQDVNDERPVFVPFWPDYPSSMAKAVLAEESKTKPGTRVFQAEATDADSNAALEYQFTPGLEASMTERFYISPTSVSLFDSLFYRKQYHPTNFLIFESSTQ